MSNKSKNLSYEQVANYADYLDQISEVMAGDEWEEGISLLHRMPCYYYCFSDEFYAHIQKEILWQIESVRSSFEDIDNCHDGYEKENLKNLQPILKSLKEWEDATFGEEEAEEEKDMVQIAREVLDCASRWEPEVLLIGNVKASELRRLALSIINKEA